jgi:glycosyltransferase involved in cell wall biosynthesis
MKILMLGWEYPPHIAGGLGTACEGLTSALADQGVSIHFVVPQIFGDEKVEHMVFTDSNRQGVGPMSLSEAMGEAVQAEPSHEITRVPAFLTPYWSPEQFHKAVAAATKRQWASLPRAVREEPVARALIEGEVFGVDLISALAPSSESSPKGAAHVRYATDIFSEVERFTADVIARFSLEKFDLIHAHDWMTFPAAVALAEATKKPLVVHIHSLEQDRSGLYVNETINQIERLGVSAADRVIAVSHYTKRSIERHHGISPKKIFVVHNGVYPRKAVVDYRLKKTWPRHVVLFLGRVTFQKGPDYFVEIASKVIPHVPDVLFVLAGNGDMLPAVMEQVRAMKLGAHFLFPGFLQGDELEEMFSIADLYVMPSVSEPFGITALEAISFDTPVLISKQSGVAEVLQHALKADFWDVERMADLIINSLLHEELRHEMVTRAQDEVRRLHWDAAALKTIEVYQDVGL